MLIYLSDAKHVFTFFLLFYKNAFTTFLLFERLLFSRDQNFYFFILINLPNSNIKRLLSDGFNMAAIGNFLMKTYLANIVNHAPI